ncbi:hypothetical protein ES703_76389 [subsurface metagenome]
MKKYLSILFALVLVVSLMLVPAVVSADGTPTIDGTLSSGEWDSYHLGTSVTGWQGGMSVDVYGFADDTHLYAAYVADMTQPGWSVAAGLCISANLDYKTPQSASWPDSGYTHISVYGDGFAQTDGSGWNWPDGWGNTDPSVFTNRGIEYYVGEPCYGSPYPNTAEIKIPLSLLTYAGADGQIMLGGQYWQYDWATPFYVNLPPIQVEIDIKPGSDPNSINLKSKGLIPVAILTTPDFDASTVDPDTVAFGPNEAACVHWALEDVDGDGDIDLILHFKTQDTGINPGDTEATLIGYTYDPLNRLIGKDAVKIVPKGK